MPLLAALSVLASMSKQCPIVEYGAATSDDGTKNTEALHKAAAACAYNGGTVVVEGGEYNIGPLSFSGKGLFVEIKGGSALVAMSGPDKWPAGKNIVEFNKCDGCGLVGAGVVWGKGGRPPEGFDWYYLFDQNKLKNGRPLMLVVNDSTNFTLTGVTLLDSPAFNVKLVGVNGAEISHINITSTWYIDPKTKELMEPHNTDGIDPTGGSSDIWIHDVCSPSRARSRPSLHLHVPHLHSHPHLELT